MNERLSQISYDDLPASVKPLADDILKISSAALGGPYNALLRSPEMARRCFDFLDYLRFRTSVNKRLNEFAILIKPEFQMRNMSGGRMKPLPEKQAYQML